MRRTEFTMVELMAVVLILGILAASVALRIHGPLRNARMRDVADAVARFDQATRLAARRQGRPMRIVMDLGDRSLQRAQADGRASGALPLRLGGEYRPQALLIDGQFVGTGRHYVLCSAMGLTPSYALLLDGAGRRRWVVVAGLTGQIFEVESEQQAKHILSVADDRVHPR